MAVGLPDLEELVLCYLQTRRWVTDSDGEERCSDCNMTQYRVETRGHGEYCWVALLDAYLEKKRNET